MKTITGFTLFEVLIAWSVFISAFLILSTVQLTCLQRVRAAYLQNLAFIQLTNVAQEFNASDPLTWMSVADYWHRLNLTLFPQVQEQWHCSNQHCCFELSWQKHNMPVRYCD